MDNNTLYEGYVIRKDDYFYDLCDEDEEEEECYE